MASTWLAFLGILFFGFDERVRAIWYRRAGCLKALEAGGGALRYGMNLS